MSDTPVQRALLAIDADNVSELHTYLSMIDEEFIPDLMEYAVIQGRIEIVRYFLDNTNYDMYEDALIDAAKAGHVRILELFVERGVNLYESSGDLLKQAAMRGRLDVVRYLVTTNPYIDVEAALYQAAYSGHVDVIRYLVDQRLGILNIDYRGQRTLYYAIDGRHMDVIRYLVEEHHVPVNDALHNAVDNGYLDGVLYLLNKYDGNELDSLLSIASMMDNNGIMVDALLDFGADPTDIADPYGYIQRWIDTKSTVRQRLRSLQSQFPHVFTDQVVHRIFMSMYRKEYSSEYDMLRDVLLNNPDNIDVVRSVGRDVMETVLSMLYP